MKIVFSVVLVIFSVAGLFTLGLIIGIYPNSIDLKILSYQTMITGFFGGFAAVISATLFYLATKLTSDVSIKIDEKNRAESRAAGAAILNVAVLELIRDLEPKRHPGILNASNVNIPRALTDYELLKTQAPAVKARICVLVDTARDFNTTLNTGHNQLPKKIAQDRNDYYWYAYKTATDLVETLNEATISAFDSDDEISELKEFINKNISDDE